MHATLPRLIATDFPALARGQLEVLQANITLTCNQACLHCHVASSPKRKEAMSQETLEQLLALLDRNPSIHTLDVTGGAPELHPQFRWLVTQARKRGVKVIDRCNLTILCEPGQETTAEFLAENQVEVVASLPCYSAKNVDAQRGDGVFEASLKGLQQLNDLGYGQEGSELQLSLVYNPLGPSLPPSQLELEQAYKKELYEHFGIRFNNLLTLANMPIQRFGSTLISRGEFDTYMDLLKASFNQATLPGLMCLNTLSVDYQGRVYDCDFNQQLQLPLGEARAPLYLKEILDADLQGQPIRVADHCYGCTAGQGSSCGGALSQ
ncbi:arsenosugar biosynthesis radical SAM (seleno)protein ArsS [Marinospirillum sp.]|uniref:arsenosugar biosynthesis radical SAM (seleno)protein ArsS n=1 Tax=Marinospirillum sp. TaxID=2183934 RepID=UPI002870AF1B|nr:arsenosugar biosynthesis radical SAM (seleno)protein ArsS [Marinospirillum sp.]MDR9468920.1 arsenosugar biosynthesis radical SAM protein ArsS [Marinospirillum sp.]